MNMETEPAKPSVQQRFWAEMRKYAFVSLYLWVCFGVLLAYESALLAEQGMMYLPYGVALIKALVIGKFILIGEAIKVGERSPGPTLHRIAWKTSAFLLMLIVFMILEEIIVGWVHGHSTGHTLSEFLARSWVEKLAPVMVMTLILIPLVSTMEFSKALGQEKFRALLTGRE